MIIIFNRTHGGITVQAYNQYITILKDSTGQINYHSLTATFPISVALYNQLQGKVVKTYKIIPVPQSYMRSLLGGIKGYEILFQIEPNGFIYILPPESKVPALKLKPQPSGFPLKPSEFK